ncbi:MAG: response regulator transcription factor [Erysipelotrichaceae bacterium]|nr:response regulator transcription factor [Erysipelotrichaceae bacterium]
MKILLVEDNLDIVSNLTTLLSNNNYLVEYATTIKEALKKLNKTYSLVILDIFLPDGLGTDLFLEIKKNYQIPSIFLTAKDLESDIVNGFNLGIDDYITKPFLSGELLARINKILNVNKLIKVSNITIDTNKMIVLKDNQEINLTSLEYQLLLLLFTNLNKVITRDKIIDKIFDLTGNDVYDNTITVYIKRIREKLDTDIIKTVKGVGYRVDI